MSTLRQTQLVISQVLKLIQTPSIVTHKNISQLQKAIRNDYGSILQSDLILIYKKLIQGQKSPNDDSQPQQIYSAHHNIFQALDPLLISLKPQSFDYNLDLMIQRMRALKLYRRPYFPILTQIRQEFYIRDVSFNQHEKMEFYKLLSLKFTQNQLTFQSAKKNKNKQSNNLQQKYSISNHSEWRLVNFIYDIIESHLLYLKRFTNKSIEETSKITKAAIKDYQKNHSMHNVLILLKQIDTKISEARII